MLRAGMLHLVRVTCYLVGGGGGGGDVLLLSSYQTRIRPDRNQTRPESDQTSSYVHTSSHQFIPDQTRPDKLTELNRTDQLNRTELNRPP